jgi:hypothetical protein
VASVVYSHSLDAVFAVAGGVLVGATLLAIVFARRIAPAVETPGAEREVA